MAEVRRDPKYYNTDKLPLLIQGFDYQALVPALGFLRDKKEFTTKVDRGVVNFIDFVAVPSPQETTGLIETNWNGAQITVLAGGQSLLKDELAERYGWLVDLGDKDEQKVQVIINGGQILISDLFITSALFSQGSTAITGQLLAHYTTKRHDEWLKENKKFFWGLGLKRQTFRSILRAGALTPSETPFTVPSNQGRIIGFSVVTFGGASIVNFFVDIAFDDLKVILDVGAPRFVRDSQRDPFIQWIDLNPGSTMQVSLKPRVGFPIVTDSYAYVTLYFAN